MTSSDADPATDLADWADLATTGAVPGTVVAPGSVPDIGFGGAAAEIGPGTEAAAGDGVGLALGLAYGMGLVAGAVVAFGLETAQVAAAVSEAGSGAAGRQYCDLDCSWALWGGAAEIL